MGASVGVSGAVVVALDGDGSRVGFAVMVGAGDTVGRSVAFSGNTVGS